MNRKWRLGEVFGIGVYIHWTFWLLLGWTLLSSLSEGEGLVPALFAVGLTASVFGCVVLHEFGHALMARRFGVETRDITLYPIGGVARLERIPDQPRQEILIALAGPAVNLVIAAGLFGLMAIGIGDGSISGQFAAPAGFVAVLMGANVLLAGFNLLPAFPMDGGRVLRAFLATRFGQLRATEIAARLGKYIAILLGIVAVTVPGFFMLGLLALFVYLAGQQELAGVRMRSARPIWRWPGSSTVIDVTARPVTSRWPEPGESWPQTSEPRPPFGWPRSQGSFRER